MPPDHTLTLHDDGRQIHVVIRPLTALNMERWLERVVELLPPDHKKLATDSTALASFLLQRGYWGLACLDQDKGLSLLEDLLAKSEFKIDSGGTMPCSPENMDTHIHEVSTLFHIRKFTLRVNLAFALANTRKPLVLPRHSAYRQANAAQGLAQVVNLPPVCSTLISQGIASLNDLRNTYNYSDALDMLEVANVRHYNQWASAEHASTQRRR